MITISNKKRLYILLFFYVILIFIFSLIYYAAYINDNRNFTINNDVRYIRRELYSESYEIIRMEATKQKEQLIDINNRIDLLLNADDKLKLNMDSNSRTITSNNKKFILKYRYPLGSFVLIEEDPPKSTILLVINGSGKQHIIDIPDRILPNQFMNPIYSYKSESRRKIERKIHSSNQGYRTDRKYMIPDNIQGFKDLVFILKKRNEKEIADLDRLIIVELQNSKELESYWDFLYFSTITQTTVGYGDILPNTTKIRMFVTLQCLLGIIIIGVFTIIITLRSK